MRLLGFEIVRSKALRDMLQPVSNSQRGGWWPIVREPYTGAWQQNVEVRLDSVLTFTPLFRCIALISSDIAKMRLKLVSQGDDGIWSETDSAAFSPVIRKPNDFQNRIQFFASWMESKLIYGNTYVLKQRDARGVVVRLVVMDPTRVTVLVAPDGSVFYELRGTHDLAGLAGLEELLRVPAREIIHDRWNTYYHPLCGLSPIYASGIPAMQGLAIQNNSLGFFTNGSQPGGVLTAPGAISDESAARLKDYWSTNFSGANVGKVAVVGDGLKYEQMATKAVDAQLVDQAKWSAEQIGMAFGVPPYKLGVGPIPTNNNVEALDSQYYSQCLQIHIEAIELALDEGLELPRPYGTEFELDDLLRMDTATLITAEAEAVKAGIKSPNEARFRLNLGPVKGGDTPYLQQQQFSLAALDERDRDNPFAKPAAPAPAPPADDQAAADNQARFLSALSGKFAELTHAA